MYQYVLAPKEREEADLDEVLAFLSPLSYDYPGFDRWFNERVRVGVRAGQRNIVRVVRDGRIAAIGIAKRTADERKICTVRVAPEYVGRGHGIRVFDTLLKWLDTDRPYLTVSESKHRLFERIFAWYGFQLSGSHVGLYIPGITEYSYNDRRLQEPSSPWKYQSLEHIRAASRGHLQGQI